MDFSRIQREVCCKYGAEYLACADRLKIGINKDFSADCYPLNGLRHPPQGDVTGWFIWSGEQFSTKDDFFVPLHAFHLSDRCPEIVKYLGLASGWRFLISPNHQDIWFDEGLLNM